MSDVIAWACTVCAGAAVCLICEMLLPKDKISKIVRFAVGVFMVGVIIIPLGGIVNSVAGEIDAVKVPQSADINGLEQQVQLDSTQLAKRNVEQLVERQLSDMGISAEKIEINTDSDKLSDITGIESVIYINERNRGQSLKIKNKIKGDLGLECKIIVIGESKDDR